MIDWILALGVLLVGTCSMVAQASDNVVKAYPAPDGEDLFDGYSVRVNGEASPVYRARVSAFPLNAHWPGTQRPLDQTEWAGFCYWDMNGPVTVDVTPHHVESIDDVVIRPASRMIVPKVDKGHITFTLKEPCQVSVEINGSHHALHLFANPTEAEPVPGPDDANVLYFGPGVHKIGKTYLKSNQTVYIAGGAVVYGAFEARDATNLTIRGRGILDGRYTKRPVDNHDLYNSPDITFGNMCLYGCEDVCVEGIVFRDSNVYVLTPVACRNVAIRNIKQIGMWRYNTDGIHMKNCQDVTIEDCFLRTFDDTIVANGFPTHRGYTCGHLPTKNVTVSRCVLWNDWGKAIRVGVVSVAPVIEDIVFRDCDIVRTSTGVFDIMDDGNALVRNILYEDIRIEMDGTILNPVIQKRKDEVYEDRSGGRHVPSLIQIMIRKSSYTQRFAKDLERGHIKQVVLRNIKVITDRLPGSRIEGYDTEHQVENILFDNIVIGGKQVQDSNAANVTIGKYVQNVQFNDPQEVKTPKAVVGNVRTGKILFLGNSITMHALKPEIGWTNICGMAASSLEKDYVHVLAGSIAEITGASPAIMASNIADFESHYETFDLAGLEKQLHFEADTVIVAIGENVPALRSEESKARFSERLSELLKAVKGAGNPTIIVRSSFWPDKTKDAILKQACAEVGGMFVDISGLSKDESNYARSERKYAHAGVAAHPGDKGMQAIAGALLAAMKNTKSAFDNGAGTCLPAEGSISATEIKAGAVVLRHKATRVETVTGFHTRLANCIGPREEAVEVALRSSGGFRLNGQPFRYTGRH